MLTGNLSKKEVDDIHKLVARGHYNSKITCSGNKEGL